jgi:hypothetical protein
MSSAIKKAAAIARPSRQNWWRWLLYAWPSAPADELSSLDDEGVAQLDSEAFSLADVSIGASVAGVDCRFLGVELFAFFGAAFLGAAFLADLAALFLADLPADFLAEAFADFFADFLADFFPVFFADFLPVFFLALTAVLDFFAFLVFLLFFALAIVILLLPPNNVYRALKFSTHPGGSKVDQFEPGCGPPVAQSRSSTV